MMTTMNGATTVLHSPASGSSDAFPPHRFIGRTEVQRVFHVSDDQLRRIERSEGFPAPVLIGSRRKWLGSALNSWLRDQKVEP